MTTALLSTLALSSLTILIPVSYGAGTSEGKRFKDNDKLNCIAHDRGGASFQDTCDSPKMTQAIDEGYRVFDRDSNDYSDGCLILERVSNHELEFVTVKDLSFPCMEADDYGFVVLGIRMQP